MLLCAGFSLLVGCGARTESFLDDGSSFGAESFGGASAGAPNGGAPHGGAPHGGTGAVSGGFFNGGASGSFGGANIAGSPFGGSNFGGFSGTIIFPTAGAGGSFGGFGAVGGFIGEAGAAGAGATGGIVEACVAVANGSCDACVCKTCAPQIEGCFSDVGCALIFACVQSTGCQGISCYSNKNCRPIIDQFGGLTGPSMSHVFGLLTCSVSSQTSCGCN